MAKINGIKKIIKEIKRHADGSVADQLKACKLMYKIFSVDKLKNGIDVSTILDVLPVIIKFMETDNHALQKHGAGFITDISNTPNQKANTQLIVDADIIPKLKNLFSTLDSDVLIAALQAVFNIAHDFPEKVFESGILPTLIQFLQTYENEKILHYSAWIITNISRKSEERVAAIFEVEGSVETLIKSLESKYDTLCDEASDSLINIIACNEEYCKRVLNLGLWNTLKKLFHRLFVAKKDYKTNAENDRSKLKQENIVKVLAIRFFKYFLSYGLIDIVMEENYISIIVQQIKDGMTPQIKIEAIKVIENIFITKPELIPTFINVHDILSLYYSNLRSTNIDLLISVLTALKNTIKMIDDKEMIRQKLHDSTYSTRLTKHCNHSNEEIRNLSTMIYEFVFDVKLVPSVGSNEENEAIEFDDNDDENISLFADDQTNRRSRKRPTQSGGSLRRSKRSKISLDLSEIEQSDTPINEENNSQYHDFDDQPENHSHVNSVLPTVASYKNHFHFGNQFGDNTVAANGLSRFYPKSELSEHFDVREIPVSLNFLDSTVATSAIKTEIMHDFDENPLKFSTHTSPAALLETTSTIDENNSASLSVVPPTNDGLNTNVNNLSTQQQSSPPVIALTLPDQPPLANHIVRYVFLLHQYCEKLGIQFNHDQYNNFIPKIDFTQIPSNSKPNAVFETIDQSGFGCFSILLTGNEENAKIIQNKINENIVNNVIQSGNFDSKEVAKILSSSLRTEHFDAIIRLLGCRILVYCTEEGWIRFGDFSNQNIPLFVFKKTAVEKNIVYNIVLSLKED